MTIDEIYLLHRKTRTKRKTKINFIETQYASTTCPHNKQ